MFQNVEQFCKHYMSDNCATPTHFSKCQHSAGLVGQNFGNLAPKKIRVIFITAEQAVIKHFCFIKVLTTPFEARIHQKIKLGKMKISKTIESKQNVK